MTRFSHYDTDVESDGQFSTEFDTRLCMDAAWYTNQESDNYSSALTDSVQREILVFVLPNLSRLFCFLLEQDLLVKVA